MQRIGPVVYGQAILFAMQLKLAFGYSIAISAHKRREIGFGRVYNVLYIVMSLYHIGQISMLIGNHDSHNCSAIVGNGHFVSCFVAENIQIGFFAVDASLKVFTLQPAYILHLICVRHIRKFLVILCCKVNEKK